MQAASTDNCNGRTGQHGKGVVARETKKILLLHGNRQTGPLLLGRLSRLQRRFYVDLQLQLVAPDAPFAEDECDSGGLYLTWWNRVGNHYVGLETTLELLKSPTWNSEHIVGIMGFSQGARLAHLLTLLHHQEIATKGVKNCSSFPNLRFVIMVGGYDAPLPDGHAHLFGSDSGPLSIPSLHIWGLADTLVPPEKSQALMKEYFNPRSHFHPGSHFVPTKGPDIKAYVDFIEVAMTCDYRNLIVKTSQDLTQDQASIVPDEEIATLQQDEIQALQAIFPDEIQIKSPHHTVENGVEFTFPIVYHFHLLPKEEHCSTSKWPIHPLTLEIVYPNKYPLASIPLFRLIHQNSSYEFPTSRADQILTILRQSSEMEMGMPSVLSGIYAVNEFLDAPLPAKVEANENLMIAKLLPATSKTEPAHNAISAGEIDARGLEFPIRVSSPERINLCNLEGLEIAEQILKTAVSRKSGATSSHATFKKKSCSGGTFDHYVIGLVGKPSAGK